MLRVHRADDATSITVNEDAPSCKAVQPLSPAQAEKLEGGVPLEELRLGYRARCCLEVKPSLGGTHAGVV